MRHHLTLVATALSLLVPAAASAVPVNIAYSAMVTSNHGDETDGVVPPGTRVSVSLQADSESLLTGEFLPAAGSAETAGDSAMRLAIDRAGSGVLIAVPGASARVLSFLGDGPSFAADGRPPSDKIWQWTAANLYLPLVDDLDGLLALTLADINGLIGAFEGMTLMTFTHSLPGGAEFERASTAALYDFSITAVPVPEPPLPVVLVLAAWGLAARFSRRREGKPGCRHGVGAPLSLGGAAPAAST
jgi:hypothetical protein